MWPETLDLLVKIESYLDSPKKSIGSVDRSVARALTCSDQNSHIPEKVFLPIFRYFLVVWCGRKVIPNKNRWMPKFGTFFMVIRKLPREDV